MSYEFFRILVITRAVISISNWAREYGTPPLPMPPLRWR